MPARMKVDGSIYSYNANTGTWINETHPEISAECKFAHDALYLLACQHDDFPRIMYYPLPEERDMDVARYFYDVEVLEAPTPSFNSDPNVVY